MKKLYPAHNFNFLNKSIIRFALLICFSIFTLSNSESQWLAGYTYRKLITINHNQVSGGVDLTNFPFLISLTHNDLRSTVSGGYVQSINGWDIAFTSSDQTTLLNFELEKYVSTTGQIVFWVQIPTLSASVNTNVYMYYDNASIVANQSSKNTWNANYVGVWHMNNGNDATVNSNNGTVNGGAVPGGSGFIGNGCSFNGIDGYLSVADNATLDMNTSVTLSAWVKQTTIASYDRIIAKSTAANALPYTIYGLMTDDAQHTRFELSKSGGQTAINGTGSITTNTWYYAVSTYNGTTRALYLNGNLVGSDATVTGNFDTNTVPLTIGCSGYTSSTKINFLNGIIDEARVSKTALSQGWVKTEYNNQSNPLSFSTFPPVFTSIAVTSATQGVLYTYNITAFDDNSDVLT